MDLRESPTEQAFRAEARDWLRTHVPQGLPSGDTREGFALHLEWERALHAARWAVVSWPEEYGGRGASVWEWLAFEEEYYAAGGPQRVTQNGIFLLAPTLFAFGTQEQQNVLLPRMAAAEDLWCQGWSEPGAGSDLASLTSRAERVDGGWRLSGQKTWTTRGAFCTHLFGLFRTDPESSRHHGLTYFLVPLDAPGVTVRGFARLDGDEGFAEVFLDDAFVPDSAVLGGVGEGWAVAMATTGSERGLTLRSPGRYTAAADRLVELARGRRATAAQREAVVQAWLDAEAYRLMTLRTVSDEQAGRARVGDSSVMKLAWSELDVRLHEAALDLLGPDAELEGPWSKGFQFALAGPIYAGTNEVQRNIVAERLLGLPREVGTVRFALPDDAVALREGLREVLADVCTPAVVRAAWDGSACEPLWKELGAFGVLGVLLPEGDGGQGGHEGLGLDELSFVAALEEAGWHGVPGPLVETASYLSCLGLPADGTARVAVQQPGIATVPHAGSATHVLRLDDGVLLPSPAVTPTASVDATRQVGTVRGEGESVDVDPLAAERATLGTAAFLLGLARRQLDVTVAYVRERRQFGAPVGSFQAVKHPLADAVTGTDLAWPVVMRAAASLADSDPAAGLHVSMAKALASDAAYATSRACLQAHGAMAYTVEYDLHLFAKRTWAMARDWGSSSDHRARIGAHLGLEDT